MSTPRVKCPTCQTWVEWNTQAMFKPFCSERCKLIDLGDWATEAHKIPGDPLLPEPTEDDLLYPDH